MLLMSTIGYIGVSNVARKIKTMYVGVDGLARKVKTAYVGVDGVARKWYRGEVPIDPTDPNTRYESKSLGTWSSSSQVDTFLSTYNHTNNYTGLKLGNYVTIQDGTYNVDWEIAGFDCEYNQTAADGTVYNNGYGILMIPKTQITTTKWSSAMYETPYMISFMHTMSLVTAANNMRNILGSHMINRNVLLGTAQSGSRPIPSTTSAYKWTTSYLTLMSVGQMTGTFASHNNKYDDGEANYKLPVFNFESFVTGSNFWSRCVCGYDFRYFSAYSVWIVYSGGSINYYGVNDACGVRPLMLLR